MPAFAYDWSRLRMSLLPIALLFGLVMGYTELRILPDAMILWGFPVLGGFAWFGRERGFSWFLAALLSLGLGFSVSKRFLERRAELPGEERLSKAYHVEGRYLKGWETAYGHALLLDRIKILSPEKTTFSLSRLTLYVPSLDKFPARHSQITAWMTLKQRQSTRPIPWPMLRWRNNHMPGFYGNVKSERLLEIEAFEENRAQHLNEGNRQLVSLFTEGKPAPLWRDRLQPFGIGHLLAISGLHCFFVFMGLQLLLWPVRRPLVRALATAAGLLLFAHWVGWSASVTRASLMLAGWQLMPIFGRVRSWLHLWFGLLLMGLLTEPDLMLMRGFWYSYAASLGLVLASRKSDFHGTPLEHPLLARLRPLLPILAAQMFVLPINLMFQGYTRYTDLLWNIFGFLFLIILGTLFLAALLALWLPFLSPLANGMEGFIGRGLQALPGEMGGELIRFPQHPILIVGILVGLAFLLHFGARELRWYGALVLLWLFSFIGQPLVGERLVMLDVGQGLCMLHVDDRGEGTFYDAGGKLAGGLRLDRLAFLFGAQKIRGAYISHRNLDHYQLLAPLPRDFPLYVTENELNDFKELAPLKGYDIQALNPGDRDWWGSFQVEKLWPDPDRSDFPNNNEESMVLLLQNQGWWMLLTGDAGHWMEQRLELPQGEGTPILQVGHHGSKSATDINFLRKFRPVAALISCGRNNRFSHPHRSVIHALNEANCKAMLTHQRGSIIISENGLLKLKRFD